MALPEGWPCNGPLLDLAAEVASRLLPAFATATGTSAEDFVICRSHTFLITM